MFENHTFGSWWHWREKPESSRANGDADEYSLVSSTAKGSEVDSLQTDESWKPSRLRPSTSYDDMAAQRIGRCGPCDPYKISRVDTMETLKSGGANDTKPKMAFGLMDSFSSSMFPARPRKISYCDKYIKPTARGTVRVSPGDLADIKEYSFRRTKYAPWVAVTIPVTWSIRLREEYRALEKQILKLGELHVQVRRDFFRNCRDIMMKQTSTEHFLFHCQCYEVEFAWIHSQIKYLGGLVESQNFQNSLPWTRQIEHMFTHGSEQKERLMAGFPALRQERIMVDARLYDISQFCLLVGKYVEEALATKRAFELFRYNRRKRFQGFGLHYKALNAHYRSMIDDFVGTPACGTFQRFCQAISQAIKSNLEAHELMNMVTYEFDVLEERMNYIEQQIRKSRGEKIEKTHESKGNDTQIRGYEGCY